MIKNKKDLIIFVVIVVVGFFVSLTVTNALMTGHFFYASETGYDNSNSTLTSTNVQDAIDELNGKCSLQAIPNNFVVVEDGILKEYEVFYVDSYMTVNEETQSCVTSTSGDMGTFDTHLYTNAHGDVYGVHTQGYYNGNDYSTSCVPRLDYTVKFKPRYYGQTVYMRLIGYGGARNTSPTIKIYINGVETYTYSTANFELDRELTMTVDENTTIRFYASSNGGSNSAWCPHLWAGFRTMIVKPDSGI